MRRLASSLAATAAVALCLAGCGGSSKPEAQAPRTPVLLGVTGGYINSDASLARREMPIMVRAGVTAFRVPFYWAQAQPYASMSQVPAAQRSRFVNVGGRPTDFSIADELVTQAARNRLALLPILLGTPSWAQVHPGRTGSPPRDPADFAAYARAVVRRYGPDGSFWSRHPGVPRMPVRTWQIWNEPNHLVYWSDQPFAPGYVRLARAARDAIKGVDPGATV